MKKSPEPKSKRYDFLTSLAHFSAEHPLWILFLSLGLSALSIYYTVIRLDFKASRNDLVAESEPAVQRFSEISEDFGRLTNAVVVAEGTDLDRMKQFILDLADRLQREPQYFDNFLYRIDTSSLEGKKLLYLSLKDIGDLRRKLEDYAELIEELAFTPQMSQIFSYINQEISEATVTYLVSNLLGGEESGKETPSETQDNSTTVPPEEKKPVDLSFLRSLLTEMRLALQPQYRFESPWDTFFKSSSKFSEDGFLVSDDHRFIFMSLNARSQEGGFTKKKVSLDRLREHVRNLLKEKYSDLKAGVTGGSALATDEMSQAMKDTTWATVITLVGIGLLFMLTFREVYNPLLVVSSLLLAICWTFGWLTLTIGHLTILSVVFTPILMGLGIDFGIHILARYNEESERKLGFSASLDEAYRHTGSGIVAGAVTTSVAFFAILLADFRGIQELGFIAGTGVLLSLLSTFTVLPALLSIVRKRLDQKNSELKIRTTRYFLDIIYRHSNWILASVALISLISITGLPRVRFDYNLLNLQASGTESVEWEQKISEGSGRSSWFAVTTADSIEEARQKEKAFKALPSVKKVDSFADLIPENQQAKIQAIHALKPLIPEYDLNLEGSDPPDPAEVLELLEKIQFKLRSDADWDPSKKPDEAEIVNTRKALEELVHTVKQSDPEQIRSRWIPFQEKLFRDFSDKFTLLKNNSNPSGPIRGQDVPEAFRQRFQGKSGNYLLQIFSRENIWEKENMTTFVDELRSTDPNITGPPVVGFIAIDLMRRGYLQGGLYALIAIFLIVLIAFRNLRYVLFALCPLTFTLLWTLGYMGWTRFDFNLANLIALPLMLGIMVDNGIHLTYRFRENPDDVKNLMHGSTPQAITLSSWTTMVGFGSLLVAKHYGVFSLGLLMTLGVGIAWVLSLLFLPSLLMRWGKKEKH